MPHSKTMCHFGTTTFVSAKDPTLLWYAAMLKTSPVCMFSLNGSSYCPV